jgi:hypothetical protein
MGLHGKLQGYLYFFISHGSYYEEYVFWGLRLPPDSANFFCLLLDIEDGGGITLRNVNLSPNYMILNPKTLIDFEGF